MGSSHSVPDGRISAFIAVALLLATVAAPPFSTCGVHVQSTRHSLLRDGTAITRPDSVRPAIVVPSVESEEVQNERELPHPDLVPMRVVRLTTSCSASLPAPPQIDAEPQYLRI
jgi:hypothetical protein